MSREPQSAGPRPLRSVEETERLQAAIIDNTLFAVVSMDGEGRVVEFNHAAEALFGFRREQAIGQDMGALLVPERLRAAHREGYKRFMRDERARLIGTRVEITALKASGEEFPVELSIAHTPLGGQHYFTAFIADLTERKRAADELARQREALRQSEKLSAMGTLLAGVAHELNNPLAILMGRAALLQAKLHDPALQSEALKIRDAAERCGRIVRTFLAMARQRPATRRSVRLDEVVTGALELLGYNLRSAGIELSRSADPALPPLSMDPDQIGQVVINLLVNAQQSLAAQAAPRRIRIATGLEEGRAFLRVSDNGPGVPAPVAARVFDPFFTTKPEAGGTGMGLAVSRAIVLEHGGEIALEAAAEGGSFVVRLPLAETLPATDPAADPVAARPAAARGKGRALVVDDELDVAEVLAEVLRGAGYDTVVAGNGREACDWITKQRFDVILCDIRMPDMDGPALWRLLKLEHPAQARRLIFITGDTLSASSEPFLRETGQPWLEKPFTVEEVLAVVTELEPGPGAAR